MVLDLLKSAGTWTAQNLDKLETAAKIGTAAYGAYASYEAAQESASAAREAAATQNRVTLMNVRAQQAETAETMRRTRMQMQSEESTARAKAAASGVRVSQGSAADYLSFMSDENKSQLDWMQQAGTSQANILQAEGDARAKAYSTQAKTAKLQGTAALAGGLSGAFAIGSDAGGWSGDKAWYL